MVECMHEGETDESLVVVVRCGVVVERRNPISINYVTGFNGFPGERKFKEGARKAPLSDGKLGMDWP